MIIQFAKKPTADSIVIRDYIPASQFEAVTELLKPREMYCKECHARYLGCLARTYCAFCFRNGSIVDYQAIRNEL